LGEFISPFTLFSRTHAGSPKEHGKTVNNRMVILFDSQGLIQLSGTCECGKNATDSFSLSEIIPEWRNNERV
jgi:hypothetical protein